jgi:hypothetical protein
VSESTITRSAINEPSPPRPPLVLDHETWLRWLEERIDPTWRLEEWDGKYWFFDCDPEREGSTVTRCAVQQCGTKLEEETLCTVCWKAWRGSGLAMEVFTAEYSPARKKIRPGTEAGRCLVRRGAVSCARRAICRGLCRSHYSLLRASTRPGTVPLASRPGSPRGRNHILPISAGARCPCAISSRIWAMGCAAITTGSTGEKDTKHPPRSGGPRPTHT